MKLFTQKGTVHKIIIAIVIVLLFNFISPTISSASAAGTAGGILFEPIKDLLLVISDGIINVTQKMLFGIDMSFLILQYEPQGIFDWIGEHFAVIAGVTIGVIVAGAGLAGSTVTGGATLPAIAAGVKIITGSIATGVLWGAGTGVGVNAVASIFDTNTLPEKLKLPMFVLSPEEIFSNKIALLDVNFFNPNEYKDISTQVGEGLEQKSTALVLQPTISAWYYALRNLAIVALLSILVYTGIRIIISSSADDKAKYKQRLMDWLVAMCLLFFMHYIMAFAVTVTQEITRAVLSVNKTYVVAIGDIDETNGKRQLSKYVYEDGKEVFDFSTGSTGAVLKDAEIIIPAVDENGNEISGKYYIQWPGNLMTKARMELQLEPIDKSQDEVLMRQFGYTLIYLALVIYTMLFLYRYLKRLLMLTFLTIIAPLMAMTYPLDKMKDGSAQGFNTWLKEYLYNLLIQPVHLILYTVLIGSAIDLAADNLIYSLVALGFILQAEKLLRKFFGFDKASTVEGGSALGGALAMQGLNMVAKAFGKGSKGAKGGGKGPDASKLPAGVRKGDKGYDADSLYNGAFGSNSNNEGDNSNNPGSEPLEGNNGSQIGGENGQDRNSGDTNTNLGGEPLEGNNRNTQSGVDDNDIRFADPGLEAAEALRDNGYAIEDGLADIGAETGEALNYNENDMLGSNIRYGNGTIARVRPIQQRNFANNANELGNTTTQSGTVNGRSTLRNRIYGQQVPRNTGTETLTSGTNNTSINGAIARNTNSNSIDNRNTRNSKLRNIAKTAGSAAKYIGPRAANFAAKTAVKTTLAGAGAMVGMAAGLVSDNYGNVGKFGLAGGAAGLAMSPGAIGTAGSVKQMGNDMVAAAEKEYAATHTADELEARQNKQADAAWMRDKERVKYYQDKMNVSKKEAQRIMKEEAIEYRKHGITDDKAIIKAMKYKDEDFGESRTSKERILLAQLASGVSKQKDIEQVEKGFKRRGIKESESRKYINAINKFNNW